MQYLHGFGNHFESEAEVGALPIAHNSPQKAPYGLYAEQLSGTSFTMPRHKNKRVWLYRLQPSVVHGRYEPLSLPQWLSPTALFETVSPEQYRWSPHPYPDSNKNFIESIVTYAVCGSLQEGGAVHLYACNQSMQDTFFYNADGDLLIVPQEGDLLLKTELGHLQVSPKEMAVIPRGMKFQVVLLSEKARGYICENFGTPFALPDLGPIGANGLANARDFQVPMAAYEKRSGDMQLQIKFQGSFWQVPLSHSPLDVVAWHGEYVPYQYDLMRFNTVNSVSYDHPDPSIFTVLTSQTPVVGLANIDFVIFPERWMVAENTFRPPYYHRNFMNEWMGLICGIYDAKENGFSPGGASLHNAFSPHGPDAQAYKKALRQTLRPQHYARTLAFMFESRYVFHPTVWAMNAMTRQHDYLDCWMGMPTGEL